ncbi:MAG: hypothetical protein COY42_16410 [Armatimonadetes bacterium CG_4_10_14_0_8_um_filter_66_14]|nr:sigma-70 family RNA polymerase sigma factor [Armatimonadota bacterium]OIO98316.1 MAG: hypothetical protein AUJ96_21510 [Armatimonadetes bacterium CG2_30_66_41]PIU90231.1 MAG: hypothetical protein COS65_26060 [Armatimonadetes bacterium CG06_land_8_20_14_3_00_66_21]PIW21113.1 MAG: hypothetical protein COW34_00290 [Armatimonadetes bacterium CG17_big_fil_post_rev_8_21_14_2_50_66_6]PIX46026.1 MAG: hypothetical protein COZ57_13605 [Armatimonadetes bacterium CG_4_8_14_3_um_filter_66_20]PIZ43141.1 
MVELLSFGDSDTELPPGSLRQTEETDDWASVEDSDNGNGDRPDSGKDDEGWVPWGAGFIDEQWSRALSKRALLSRGEEIELARKAQAGDEDAREHFIESNFKLVISVAKRYRNSGVPMEDLIQEGNLGLIKAVDKFDPDRGCRFSTHAVLWIEGQIRRSIANLRHNVHLPLRIVADLSKLSRVTDELTQKFGQKPSAMDLAETMEASVGHVTQLLELRPDPVSLDETIDGELGMFLSDVLEDENTLFPDDFAVRRESQREVLDVLQALPERYQLVLRLRYGLDDGREHTLEEIGQKLNLTRQRVRQIEMTALKKMRCMDCPRLHLFDPEDVVA